MYGGAEPAIYLEAMSRLTVLALLLCLPCRPQFVELAATDDGSQLYLSSRLTLTDTPAAPEWRIYRLTMSSIGLFAERGPLAYRNGSSSSAGARLPQVSGDGQVVAFTQDMICATAEPCQQALQRAEIRGPQPRILGQGEVQMSRNGRWAAVTDRWLEHPKATLFDLETGRSVVLPGVPAFGRSVASNGSVVLLPDPYGFVIKLWSDGQVSDLNLGNGFAGISDDGLAVAYLRFRMPFSASLTVSHLVTGREVELQSVSTPGAMVWFDGMTNDGRYALYRVSDQALEGIPYVADSLTGESVRLTDELASTGTISGYGNAVFLVMRDGRVMRVDLAGGRPVQTRTLVPPTPYVSNIGRGVPGSLLRLEGTLRGTVDELQGRILLDERPVPVLFANEHTVGIQIPWEQRLPAWDVPFRLDVPSESPFRQRDLVWVAAASLSFEPLDPGSPVVFPFKAVRGDFSGVLTEQPKPGDVFHVYATGLGPVRGDVQTASPAPADRLLPVEAEVRCRFSPYQSDAETLFAGLAPGMIGVYQITFRLPLEEVSGPISGGDCRYGSSGVSFGFIGSRPAP
jgi:uncharacterized protein (TIGR03437 family)